MAAAAWDAATAGAADEVETGLPPSTPSAVFAVSLVLPPAAGVWAGPTVVELAASSLAADPLASASPESDADAAGEDKPALGLDAAPLAANLGGGAWAARG
ncbi:MAG TPA: hypothetical protein VMU37_08005 [Caulobacteraceae bacterium]|nr:hypothetical protein [Caulobacteraceae bacterium]